MTLQQLRYFLTVCEANSITVAADTHYVSQPAISRALRDLETEWGVQLFVRKRNKLYITEAGSHAYTWAQKLTGMADEFDDDMRSMGMQKSSLSIVMNSTMALMMFPTLIASFKKNNPDIQIQLIEVKEHANERFANDSGTDLLMMSNADHLVDKSKFSRQHVYDTEFVILAGVDTPVAQMQFLGDDMKIDRPMITDYYPRDLYGDSFIPKRLAGFMDGHSIQVLSSQFSLNLGPIRNCEVYGFTFREIANRCEGIRGVPLETPWKQSIDLYYHTSRKWNHALNRFLTYVKNYDYSKL